VLEDAQRLYVRRVLIGVVRIDRLRKATQARKKGKPRKIVQEAVVA
jgi:hypothetical protein